MRRTRPVPLALALALTVAGLVVAWSAAPAGATGSFTFYGGGWGHGVGMGQYGALGLSQQGWNDTTILTHYYPGTNVQAMSSPSDIRVGLVQDYTGTSIKPTNGSMNLQVGKNPGTFVATIPEGQLWTIQVHSDGKYWIKQPNGTYVGGKGWGSPSKTLYGFYGFNKARVFAKATGHTYDKGQFQFNSYDAGCGGTCYRVRLVLQVPTNDYVYGVAEVPNSWPMPALETQAIAARTYAAYEELASGGHRSGCNCGVYPDTRDQVYIGYDKINSPGGQNWKSAADATASLMVTYKAAVAQTFFSSSTGGYTESNAVAWGGSPVPYLKEVCDPGDYTSDNPLRTWQVSLSGDTVGSRVSSYTGVQVGSATEVKPTKRSGSGRVEQVQVSGTKGSVTMTGDELTAALGLDSTLFYVNTNKLVTGDIRSLYDSLSCSPGLPSTPQGKLAGGSEQTFTNGNIYLAPSSSQAHYLSGPILAKYQSLGGPNGFLGFPTTGVQGTTGGKKATFVGGMIYSGASTGAHEIHGLVMNEYLNLGGAQSSGLGLPTSDVSTSGNVESSTFQHGSITCKLDSGTCTVTKS